MKNLKIESLPNKLPLFMLKSTKAPVVTLQVWVKTGSAHELSSEAGLSHFIEHLVFKGTESFAPGEIAQIVESVGGELNAYTSFDQTVFYVTVPKKDLGVAAQVLSEMMTSPLFDAEEVDNEREVVVEEIKMGMDQPGRVASKMLFSQMFEGHPYALPVIGTEENIRRVELDEIKSYFGERYVGKNMSLVCVGDFDDNSIKTIEKYFSKIKYTDLPERERIITPRQLNKHNRIKFTKSKFEKDHFYLSWPVEGYLDDKVNAYELLALVLGQGESSYLYKDLKLKKGLCRSVGASYFGDKEEGIFVISGVASLAERDKLFAELPKTVKSFFEQKDISSDLEKARNIFESESSYAEESISSLCRTIGDDWLYYGKPGVSEERKEQTLKLTEKDLLEAAKSIFQKEAYLSVLSQEDKTGVATEMIKAFDNLKEIEIAFQENQKKFIETPVETGGDRVDQETFSWTTSKGSKVSFVSQPLGSVVSFKMAFEGGELLSAETEQGLVSLFGNNWAREFKGLSEEDFVEEMDFYCSGFSAFAGKHSVGLNLVTLTKYFNKLSKYFVKTFEEGAFNHSVVEREKASLLQKLQTRVDRPSAVAFNAFSEKIFKDSLYARDTIGVEDQLKALTVARLEDYASQVKTQKRHYSIVGNLTKSEVAEVIETIEAVLPEDTDASLFPESMTPDRSGERTVQIESAKKQSHIIMGYPGLTYGDDNKLHLELLTSLLGGQGGRLFIELRDKASLAYSVAPLEYSGLLGGYFGGYIACDPSKKDQAIQMMREELQKLSASLVSEEELAWMRNQTIGGFAMSSQKNSFICDTMLFDSLYGLDPFQFQKLDQRLSRVTPEDLKKTISEILEGPEFVVSVG